MAVEFERVWPVGTAIDTNSKSFWSSSAGFVLIDANTLETEICVPCIQASTEIRLHAILSVGSLLSSRAARLR